ncbi:MAG: hypothetical protein COB65_06975, partial [Thalassobium sp.]
MSHTAESKMQFLFKLRSKGVTDKRTLTAMEKTDRALFVRGVSERSEASTTEGLMARIRDL